MLDQFYKNNFAIEVKDFSQFSEDQKNVICLIKTWWKDTSKKQHIVIGGVAGSGKTTLLSYLCEELNLNERDVLFCALTGKAALALKRKGLSNTHTIHSAIYDTKKYIVDGKIYFQFEKKSFLTYKLIVVDESSMINEQIFNDLLSFNIPVVFVGDHQQLPPVKSKFNLMNVTDYRMQQVLRQQQNNPIIRLSQMAIRGQKIPFEEFGKNIVKVHLCDVTDEMLLSSGQIICGTNKKRKLVNQTIREIKGFGDEIPKRNEKLICMANNLKNNLFHGQIVYLTQDAKVKKDVYQLCYIDQLEHDDVFHEIVCNGEHKIKGTVGLQKEELMSSRYKRDIVHFNFGYCITAHLAQGSSWKNVMIFDENFGIWQSKETNRRWMYTAITRAEEELIIVSK